MKSWSIKTKLIAIILTTIVGLLVVFSFVLIDKRKTMVDDRNAKVQNLVQIAHQIVNNYYEGASIRSQYGEDEAKSFALLELRKLRYGKDDYFWINDLNYTMVMHPFKPELETTNVQKVKDSNGELLFEKFVTLATSKKEGFVSYYWPMPGKDKGVEKTSYIKLFEPWGWIIGTGVYLDDVNEAFYNSLIKLIAGGLVISMIIILPLIYLRIDLLNLLGGEPKLAVETTKRIAVGDLKEDIPDPKGESLLHYMNEMQTQLRSIIKTVNRETYTVLNCSRDLLDASVATYERSEKQNEAAQAIASSVEQMAVSISHIADNTKEGLHIVETSIDISNNGRAVIKDTSSGIEKLTEAVYNSSVTIKQLKDSIDNIDTVVKTIKDIAEKTNLLALNAAIEAARAGEYGRGFAVVADEVKKLSEMTRTSTTEITQIVTTIQKETLDVVTKMDTSVEYAKIGLSQSKQLDNAIQKILDQTNQVAEIMASINDSIQEQSTVGNDIASRIETIAHMVDENAIEVSKTKQSATQLKDLSQHLRDTVTFFKL